MHDGKQVGYASTSTWSPVLKKYIALAHLQRPYYEPGTQLSRWKSRWSTIAGTRRPRWSKLPFYEPEWKKK